MRPTMSVLFPPNFTLRGRFAFPDGDGGAGGGAGGAGDGGAAGGAGGAGAAAGAGGAGGEGGGGDGKGAGDGKKAGEGEGGEGGDGAEGGGGKAPVPYARFQEVTKGKRTAERALADAQRERDEFKARVDQLSSSDAAGTLTKLQGEVADLKRQSTELSTQVEEILDEILDDLPDSVQAAVRDIPGGPLAQFRYFNKHRATFVPTGTTETAKGKKGPQHDKKPEGAPAAGQPSALVKGLVGKADDGQAKRATAWGV